MKNFDTNDLLLLGDIDQKSEFNIYDQIINKNYDKRRLIINETIKDSLLETICFSIIAWNEEDKFIPVEHRKKIYLFINCDGGDVPMGNMILSVIESSKTPVVTIGLSRCSSMACYILAAGKEKYCFSNTVVLYHDGQSGYMTSSNKGRDIQNYFDKVEEKLMDFMIKHTNMSPEFIESIKDREYYMFAEEVKERGIVDKIIGVDCTLDEVL